MDNNHVARELVKLAKNLSSREWNEDPDVTEHYRERAIKEFQKHAGGEPVTTAEKVKGVWTAFTTELGAYRIAHKYGVNWRDLGESKNIHRGTWWVDTKKS